MDKDQAKTVIRTIQAYYPAFMKEKDKEVALVWMKKLMKANYEMTMAKLDHYAEREEFPPKIANIIYIERIKKADAEMMEAMEQVKREKADPDLSKEREEKLKKLSVLLKGGTSDE